MIPPLGSMLIWNKALSSSSPAACKIDLSITKALLLPWCMRDLIIFYLYLRIYSCYNKCNISSTHCISSFKALNQKELKYNLYLKANNFTKIVRVKGQCDALIPQNLLQMLTMVKAIRAG